jgi:hypothetical protein
VSALPLQSRYGPTLGELLAPRWRRSSRVVRALVMLAGALLVVAVVATVLTLEHPKVSRGGAVSFSFSYPGLYRARPAAGERARVRRTSGGRLEDSFAVSPLGLARYRGEPSAALALYASARIRQLAAIYPGFKLRGEGWTQLNSVSAYAVYNIFFRARLGGREVYGRDVLLLPERAGARRGVQISMLNAAGSDKQVDSPLLVGAKGVLAGPLASFALG